MKNQTVLLISVFLYRCIIFPVSTGGNCVCVWSGVLPSRWICMFLTIKDKEKRK